MALRRVQVTDFRCLHSADLEIDPRFTLISGPNASGKTSLLEAIYVLGRGRSFRTRRPETLIRRSTGRFVVFGEVERGGRKVRMGLEGSAAGTRAQIGGSKPTSLAELALHLPVQIIDPEVHRLIEEGPNRRRRFLDWGVFHVKQSFISDWQNYNQVLKQRNAALKAGQARDAIAAWDIQLLRYGLLITAARHIYVEQLQTTAAQIAGRLLGADLALNYRYGWNKDFSFEDALARSRTHDVESGVTQVGPHRGEMAIRLDGVAAKDHVSRGQQKLLAAALLIAQLRLFPVESDVQPTLLLDDPAAELDCEHLATLINELDLHPVQLVVTTLQREFSAFGTPGRRFEIHRGTVILA